MPLDQRRWIKLLEKHGWTLTRGGKHAVKLTKPGHRPIPLPHHSGGTYDKSLDAAIRRQAGLR